MPFSDPIVAGAKLVRSAVESPNYAPGMTGWSIQSTGYAEFNNVIINGGELLIADPSGSHARIYNSPGVGPTVELLPSSIAGHVVAAGNVTSSSDGVAIAATEIVGPTVDGSPQARISLRSDTAPSSFILALAEGVELTADDGVTSSDLIIRPTDISLDSAGTIQVYQPVDYSPTGAIEDWTDIAPLNGWTNRGAGYAKFAFRHVACPPRSIHVVGNIIGGAYAGGTIVGQLPAGAHPATIVSIALAGAVASAATATPTLQVTTDGNIHAWYMAAGGYAEFSAVIPLDAPSG